MSSVQRPLPQSSLCKVNPPMNTCGNYRTPREGKIFERTFAAEACSLGSLVILTIDDRFIEQSPL